MISMIRRLLAATVTVALMMTAGTGYAAHETPVAGPFKIFAVLWRGETDTEEGFIDYMNQHNIPFEFIVRDLDLNSENIPAVMKEIEETHPDLVYTWGTGVTSKIFGKVANNTPAAFLQDFPGIFVAVSYPEEAKLIQSFETPGRSVTGVSFIAPVEVQLNAIQSYREFKKIAVIYDPTAGNSRINVEQLREGVPKAGMELIELPVPLDANGKPDPATLPDLVKTVQAKGAEILYIGPDSFLVRHSKAYTAAAIEAGLPTFAAIHPFLKDSRAMFGLVTDYYTMGKLAGTQAEKILMKKRPAEDLPVASLARYKLWINIDVVREMDIYPPMDMISIADFKVSPR